MVTTSTEESSTLLSNQSYGSTDFKNQAQQAHAALDVESSKYVHDMKNNGTHEQHLEGGDHIKSAVYGGLDGIITTFATVTSVAGSGLHHSVILILGLAHLVADGLSMGLGDTLSSEAEADLVRHERRREEWEFENYPEGEIAEMIELYEKRGISHEDAKLVIHTLAKYKDAFIDIMMVEELNLMPVDEDHSAYTAGFITFVSFMLFGSVPLLPYLVNLIPGLKMDSDTVLALSCILTMLTMFMLGSIKGKFVGQAWWKAGLSMMCSGTLAAICGWVIGYLLQLTGIQNVA